MFQHNQECAPNLKQKNPEHKKIGESMYLKNRLVDLGKK